MMESIFQRQPNIASKMLNQWLERLLKIIFRLIVVLSTPAMVVNLLNFYNNGWYFFTAVCVIITLVTGFVAFYPKVTYQIRAHALLWLTYALTLISTYLFGLSGDARVWIIFSTLFATLFFGLPFGIGFGALNLITFALFGWGMVSGFLPMPSIETQANTSTIVGWTTTGSLMLFVLVASSLSVGYLVNYLNESLEDRLHANKQLHALTHRLIAIQEGERQDLARELHDDTLNALALFTLDLREDTTKAEISEKIQNLAENLRNTINGLRPPSLDLGLAVSIEHLVDTLEERLFNQCSKTTIRLNCQSEPVQFNTKIEQQLYRIVQQACENAIQHAKAKNIMVDCEITYERVILQVADDGVGFSSHPKAALLTSSARRWLRFLFWPVAANWSS